MATAFRSSDALLQEARRVLADVRQEYDQVHLESERREAPHEVHGELVAEIVKLREQIRVADRSHGYGADESSKNEDRMARHQVAKVAATEAFEASAGRLRKLYAVARGGRFDPSRMTFAKPPAPQQMRLDTLREQFERFKRDTDGLMLKN
eukprot:Skav231433  [mRNA]  locus=scaffold330:188609:193650:+ [translate_table: standard]